MITATTATDPIVARTIVVVSLFPGSGVSVAAGDPDGDESGAGDGDESGVADGDESGVGDGGGKSVNRVRTSYVAVSQNGLCRKIAKKLGSMSSVLDAMDRLTKLGAIHQSS
jgi:hypothetical protein